MPQVLRGFRGRPRRGTLGPRRRLGRPEWSLIDLTVTHMEGTVQGWSYLLGPFSPLPSGVQIWKQNMQLNLLPNKYLNPSTSYCATMWRIRHPPLFRLSHFHRTRFPLGNHEMHVIKDTEDSEARAHISSRDCLIPARSHTLWMCSNKTSVQGIQSHCICPAQHLLLFLGNCVVDWRAPARTRDPP